MINSKKIILGNERSTHLTKRLNRLSKWQFYQVLNRTGMSKIFLLNFMVLFFCAAIIYLMFSATQQLNAVKATLPLYGSFILGTGMWTDVNAYLATQTLAINQTTLLWGLLGALPLMFVFSGVFAIIRDAFWVGTLSIFKSFGRGVKANIVYSLIATILLEGMIFGLFQFYWWSISALATWLAILLTVLLAVVAVLVTIYLLILCSVTVTYKQSVKQNLADTWRLMWLNILPNFVNFVIACIPLILYFALSGLQMIMLMFMLLWGAFWIPFVWQTHMMKTFALFHPVLVNKKGEPKGETRTVEQAVEEKQAQLTSAPQRKEVVEHYNQTRSVKIKKKGKNNQKSSTAQVVESVEQAEQSTISDSVQTVDSVETEQITEIQPVVPLTEQTTETDTASNENHTDRQEEYVFGYNIEDAEQNAEQQSDNTKTEEKQ